jgi:3-oxoacyl-[acyl-carrier protein] reductase
MADVALVTGGTGGIGRAISQRLTQAGYAILAGDVTVESGPARKKAAKSGDVIDYPLDVQSLESLQAAVSVAAQLGRLTAVVNCAGILRDTPAASLPEQTANAVWSVNVLGSALVVRAALPHLHEGSAIVNIGSIAGAVGRFPRLSIYSASKAAIEGLTRVQACELAPRGIRVNAVAPGFIRVPMSRDWEEISGGEEALISHVPLGRLGTTGEVAEVVEFLLSPRSSYITGTTIYVDGGVSAW